MPIRKGHKVRLMPFMLSRCAICAVSGLVLVVLMTTYKLAPRTPIDRSELLQDNIVNVCILQHGTMLSITGGGLGPATNNRTQLQLWKGRMGPR